MRLCIAEMRKQIQDLLDQGVIETCVDSPFAFPVVMARRPGSDKLRMCIDLNRIEISLPLLFRGEPSTAGEEPPSG